jgi:hypothetical protein
VANEPAAPGDVQDEALPLANERDIVSCRQLVRKLAQQLRFSLVDQTKMITAASELSRNAIVHGGGGEMRWQIVAEGSQTGLRGSRAGHRGHRTGADRRLDVGVRHGHRIVGQPASRQRLRVAHARGRRHVRDHHAVALA